MTSLNKFKQIWEKIEQGLEGLEQEKRRLIKMCATCAAHNPKRKKW